MSKLQILTREACSSLGEKGLSVTTGTRHGNWGGTWGEDRAGLQNPTCPSPFRTKEGSVEDTSACSEQKYACTDLPPGEGPVGKRTPGQLEGITLTYFSSSWRRKPFEGDERPPTPHLAWDQNT